MELPEDLDQLAKWMAEFLRADLEIQTDKYLFGLRYAPSDVVELNKEELSKEFAKLHVMEEVGEMILANPHSYEILVREEGRFLRFRPRKGDNILEVADPENELKYILSRPSNEYILFLLNKSAALASPRSLSNARPARLIYERAKEAGQIGVFDLAKQFLPNLLTLQVYSMNGQRPYAEFEKYSSAFLFNLSYNTDAALVQQRHMEELLRTGRLVKTRRVELEEIDAPRRHYVPDLIYHYQLAVGTDSPLLEYISYYHIAEHFFESVFNEELVEKISLKITHPDFSYKRKKDIASLIKNISNSLQIRNDRISFSESEALKLTLKKHINLKDLVERLREYDESLIDYYRENKVPFSEGDAVDIIAEDNEMVYKKLAARIYKTRNAIVHSKESDKYRYMPFRDDRHLVKEVPVLRFIAEQIIFSSSVMAS